MNPSHSIEKDAVLSRIKEILEEYYSVKREEFIPGKTKIRVAEPTYNWKEVLEVLDSLLSTRVTMGEKVGRFEEAFESRFGAQHAIMVNSGSSANMLAMNIVTCPSLKDRIPKGAEVVTPAVTWSTTVYPISFVGLVPVFVDVNLSTYDISVEKLEEALSSSTGAVFVVHLLGGACDMEAIKKICDRNSIYLL